MESDLTISEVQNLAFQFFEDPQVVGLVFGGGAGGGKGLALDTKILTTHGWTTMGELKEGDYVFDKDGLPSKVVLVSDIHHRPCYKLTFSDDSYLIADDEHRWLTFNNEERFNHFCRGTVRDTQFLFNKHKAGDTEYAVPAVRRPAPSFAHMFEVCPYEDWRYIISIEKVESVPTKCIMVDSPSRTYLAGETLTVTHNTFLLGLIAAIACKKYPGTRWGLARKELKSLKQTTLATLISKVHPSLGITENDYKLNLLDSTLEYVNGSSLLLLDLTAKPSDPEMESLGSLELTGAFIDEVGEVNKKPYDILASRVNRWLNKEYGITGKVVSSCNPSPSFVRQEFYDKYAQLGGGRVQKWQNGHVWVKGERLPAYNAYIRSTVLDNPFVDENYVESLRRLPPLEKRRLLDGNWDYADEDGALFPTALIDKMTVYEVPEPEKTSSGEDKFNKFIGIDPSDAGKDDTVLTLVENGVITDQIEISSPKGKDDVISLYIANKVLAYAQKHGFTPALAKNITLEGNGVGAALRDSLRALGWKINVYTAGASTRNEGYYQFMLDAEEGKIKILNTVIEKGELVRQLSVHKYDTDTGKPKITSKKELRRTLGRSPDHADSAMIGNMAANKFKPKNVRAFIRW